MLHCIVSGVTDYLHSSTASVNHTSFLVEVKIVDSNFTSAFNTAFVIIILVMYTTCTFL